MFYRSGAAALHGLVVLLQLQRHREPPLSPKQLVGVPWNLISFHPRNSIWMLSVLQQMQHYMVRDLTLFLQWK